MGDAGGDDRGGGGTDLDPGGRPLPPSSPFRSWAIVGVLAVILPAFRGPPNRGLHDLVAGTVVTLPPGTRRSLGG